MDWLMDWFGEKFYMPHGHCYLWQPEMLWLQVLTNAAIGVAYLAITVTLYVLVRRSRDMPFSWMFVAFGVFIVTCGFTHFSDVLVIWKPAYYLDGTLRAITAVASLATAFMLPPLVPKAIALTEAARVSHERGIALEEANKNLAQLLDRTKELEQLKTQFFANVSHELRTPLALVLGPSEKLLARADLPADARRDLEVIGRNARTLLRHVNDLLDVSKLEAGRLKADYRRLHLAELVRTAAAHFDALAAERGITFDVRADSPIPVEGDPDKLQRVVVNLLSNAFKFTPDGGRIRCEVGTTEDRARVVVADSGPGIRPEEREIIFERFRQLEGGSTRRFGGTGLGLAITRDFVSLHGGEVAVGDAPEGGALFTVSLPLRAPAGTTVGEGAGQITDDAALATSAQAAEALQASTQRIEVATGGAGRSRVLVVEDNDELRRFVAETLATEHDVDTAANGRLGLERARERAPDLVVTDIMMPELSGDELVRALRAERAFDGVPIMLLTAKADDELRVALLRDGAQDYLLKPFAVEELRVRARNLVTAKRARELLQRELDSQLADLEALAGQATQRKRELEGALEAMRVARTQAENAARARTSFLGLVSHELRRPLASLTMQLERLKLEDSELTGPQRGIVDRMERTTGRLTDLIESLLTHARMQARQLEPEVVAFSPAELARDIIEEMQGRAVEHGLTLTLEVSAAAPVASTDPRLVRLVLANLIDNAIKYTPAGQVEVSVTAEPGGHLLQVRDTGAGIRPEDQVRIFRPFEQLQPISGKSAHGMGLGLAIVRDIVTALRGALELESAVGVGSTFTVRIPDLPPGEKSL